MGQISSCLYSPKCSISSFTRCHLNCWGELIVCTGDRKEVVISEAVWQCKNQNTPFNNERRVKRSFGCPHLGEDRRERGEKMSTGRECE